MWKRPERKKQKHRKSEDHIYITLDEAHAAKKNSYKRKNMYKVKKISEISEIFENEKRR